jgi:hypothetical protein
VLALLIDRLAAGFAVGDTVTRRVVVVVLGTWCTLGGMAGTMNLCLGGPGGCMCKKGTDSLLESPGLQHMALALLGFN